MSTEVRTRAIGMLEGGLTQKEVASRIGKDIRTIKRWWKRFTSNQSLDHKPCAGRPSLLNPVAKMIIGKSLGKRHQSTRRLSAKLKSKGYSISKSTVHTYLSKSLGVKAIKRPQQPKLTGKQKANKLEFCRKYSVWLVEDWKCILWTDESPFELFHPSNHQNDRVWCHNSSDVLPQETVKFPQKIMVWGMMSHQVLSELHIVPPKRTVNASYYVSEILTKTCEDALNRKRKTGAILEKRMIAAPLKATLMQDGSPPHRANITQNWCKNHLPNFWAKEKWPGNSPDLNPIENLWSILKQRLDQLPQSYNLENLKKSLKIAWSNIDPSCLENLVAGMPNRIRKCLELEGGYIGK